MKNKNKEKERIVHTVGRPSIEQLSKDERRVFYGTLLARMMASMSSSLMQSDMEN